MLKNTVTGSVLAKLLPSVSKYFLENASQEEVNKAEQEAAVIHQQLNSGVAAAAPAPTETTVAAAAPAAMPLEVPAPAASTQAVDVVALTKRATDAEAKAADLQTKLSNAEKERDQYKAWYDKQAGAGTKLPGADASTRGTVADADKQLSAATQNALDVFRKRKAGA